MRFFPIPDMMKRDIYEISPEEMKDRGVELVMLDVDNTLAPYTDDNASGRLVEWAEKLKKSGLKLFILSNNKGKRPERFAKALGIEYIGKARKPFTKTARQALEKMGLAPEKAALVGDQIYTDTLCAVRTGMLAVLVEPIKFTNIFLWLRYQLERPFRAVGRTILRDKEKKAL